MMYHLRLAVLWLLLLCGAAIAGNDRAGTTSPTDRAEDNLVPAGDLDATPWVPDLHAGNGRRTIPEDKRIDVLILGDGYLDHERARFERDVREWYEGFVALTPWREMRGAFRVQGYWTPSVARATQARESYYQTVEARPTDATGPRVFASLRGAGCNPAVRSGALTHTTVMMLICDENGRNPSGAARTVRESPTGLSVRVGFGAYTHHEFGHAFGGLRDEYIRGEGGVARDRTPAKLSIYSLPNLSYTKDPALIPWKHLMPGSAANPESDSVIGVLWIGGAGAEIGVWHSEGKCLMNGTHDNWNFDRTRRGVTLRDRGQFCFWCEEILVARVWERTGQFGELTDGIAMYEQWETEVRPAYHRYFDVPRRIRERNAGNREAGWAAARIFERIELANPPSLAAEAETGATGN